MIIWRLWKNYLAIIRQIIVPAKIFTINDINLSVDYIRGIFRHSETLWRHGTLVFNQLAMTCWRSVLLTSSVSRNAVSHSLRLAARRGSLECFHRAFSSSPQNLVMALNLTSPIIKLKIRSSKVAQIVTSCSSPSLKYKLPDRYNSSIVKPDGLFLRRVITIIINGNVGLAAIFLEMEVLS